jgi:hypothetical protein
MPMSRFGLLAPASSTSERRTRSLGLGAATRHHNERAVPGLGGLWFTRPLVWSLLGIHLARQTGRSPVAVANAIEALACHLAFRDGRARDPRVRGRTKLSRVARGFVPYARASRPGFYVTQPMRQGLTQPLLDLGLVESGPRRFNAYHLSKPGESLLDLGVAGFRPHNTTVVEELKHWLRSAPDASVRVATDEMARALSPVFPAPETARRLLRDRLVAPAPLGSDPNDPARRKAVMAWVATFETQQPNASWDQRPSSLSIDHWEDLHTGGEFFQARDAALAVLNHVERLLAPEAERRRALDLLAEESAERIQTFIDRATGYLERPETTRHVDATRLFGSLSRATPAQVLTALVDLDGRGLTRRGSDVLAGPAYQGAATAPAEPTDEEGAAAPEARLILPPGISGRIRSAWTLHLDLEGRLETWLGGAA